jgi:hypothetical protein
MRKTDIWRRYPLQGGRYEDAKQYGKYMMSEIITDDNVFYDVWTPKNLRCMSAVVQREYNTAIISGIGYDSKCTITEDMKHGKDTREMIQFVLDFLRDKGVETISLMDNSHIECGDQQIDLSAMYFLKYGMTWYEKYFGFQPAQRFQDNYHRAKKARIEELNIPLIQKQPCDFFITPHIEDLFHHIGLRGFYNYEWVLEF